MAIPSFFNQLLATDPRKLVRFPEYPIDAALAELQQLQDRVNATPARPSGASTAPIPPAPEPAAKPVNVLPEGLAPSIAALATHVWRTRGRLIDPATGEPKEEGRKVYRHVEASLESLAQMGVTINDWMDQRYDPGLPVKVLTFQPTPGVPHDTIIETVKPTVIWRDQLLQLAEVVVGIPANTDNT